MENDITFLNKKKYKEKEDEEEYESTNETNISTPIKLAKNIYSNNFENNINIKYLKELCSNSENIGYNDLIEVYNIKNDLSAVYIAIKNNETQNVDIYEFTNIEKNGIKILSLKGHFDKLTGVRYFKDNYRNNEYLLSLDRGNTVLIWLIKDRNNYIRVRKLESDCPPGKNIIYSCLVFFTKQNNYIITTKFCFGKMYSKLINFDTGKLISNLKFTERNKTRHIIQWIDESNNNTLYAIEICFNCKVVIYEPLTQKIYAEIEINGDNICGCIIKSEDKKYDLMCINSTLEESSIYIYNLQKKIMIENFKLNSCLYQMIPWNDNYILAADKNNRSLDIIDIKQKKIIFMAKGRHTKAVKCAKKIRLNNDEIVFTCGIDSKVQIWINDMKKIKIKKPY